MPKYKNSAKLRRPSKRQDAWNEREWELTQRHLTASPSKPNPLCLPALVPNQPPHRKSTEFVNSGRKVLGELLPPTQLQAMSSVKQGGPTTTTSVPTHGRRELRHRAQETDFARVFRPTTTAGRHRR